MDTKADPSPCTPHPTPLVPIGPRRVDTPWPPVKSKESTCQEVNPLPCSYAITTHRKCDNRIVNNNNIIHLISQLSRRYNIFYSVFVSSFITLPGTISPCTFGSVHIDTTQLASNCSNQPIGGERMSCLYILN